jgi:hypothetical protein
MEDPMRFYFHIKQGASLIEDEEGTDLPNLSAAREAALEDLKLLVSSAIRHGGDVAEAMIVTDDTGARVAAVPIVATLPQPVVDCLNPAQEALKGQSEDYRQHAADCRKLADQATNPADKVAWLNLANSWLRMLPESIGGRATHHEGWPKPSDEDSQASH